MNKALPAALRVSLGSPKSRCQHGIRHARDLLGELTDSLPVRGDGEGIREGGESR